MIICGHHGCKNPSVPGTQGGYCWQCGIESETEQLRNATQTEDRAWAAHDLAVYEAAREEEMRDA